MASPRITKIIARSPIAITLPITTVGDWEVSGCTTDAPLRIVDVTAAAKYRVVASPRSAAAALLSCRFQTSRREGSTMIVGIGADEWLVVVPAGEVSSVVVGLSVLPEDDLSVLLDVTHAGVFMRITGDRSVDVLTRMCAMDFSDAKFPNGATFRSSLARVVCDVIRDDILEEHSYLIHGDRSSGQYLFNSFLNVGAQFSIAVAGYPANGF